MGMTRNIRVRTGLLGLLGGSLLLTGCMGPTYGTDKTAGEQLIDDLGNAIMVQADNKDAKKIRYQPRGSLVIAEAGDRVGAEAEHRLLDRAGVPAAAFA